METKTYSQQIPASQFIAYTEPELVQDEQGESVLAGSQVIIKVWRNIKVKNISEGGYKGKKNANTARIEFDPHSIDLSHAINGNINPDDPCFEILKEAMENDEAVDVVLETSRKRYLADKSLSDPLRPIKFYTGASTPEGKSSMEASRDNTVTLIAGVNGQVTVDARSMPDMWAKLVRNNYGQLCPVGYKLVTDSEDWKKYGYIVPDQNNIVHTSTPAQKETTMSSIPGYDAPLLSDDTIGEDAPYKVWTAHKHINLGLWAVSDYRYLFSYFTKQGMSEPKEIHAAIERIMIMADDIQLLAYNMPHARADRTVRSHREAIEWVIIAQDELGMEEDEAIVSFASKALRGAGNIILKSIREPRFLSTNQASEEKPASKATVETPGEEIQEEAQHNEEISEEPAEEPVESAPAAEENPRLVACVEATNRFMGNAEKLRAIYGGAKNENLLQAKVEFDGDTLIINPDGDMTLEAALVKLGRAAAAQKSAPAPAQEKTPDVEPEPEEEPQSELAQEDVPVEEPSHLDDTDDAPTLTADELRKKFKIKSKKEESSAADESESEESSSEALVESLKNIVSPTDLEMSWTMNASDANREVMWEGETVPLSEVYEDIKNNLEHAEELAEKFRSAKTKTAKKKLIKEAADYGHYLVEADTEEGELVPLASIVHDEEAE